MIVSEIFYGVKCNRCGEQYEDGEHSFWSDESGAVENAMESEWIEEKGKHYCTKCYEYNEEFEIQSIKPDFPKNVKLLKKFFDRIIIGHSSNITEQENEFKVSIILPNQEGLKSYDTNYITDMLGSSLISIKVEKHERWSSYNCVVLVRRDVAPAIS